MESIVIVGGGQAASSAAAKLRELDSDVNITILSAEPVLPYQRPPLSKKYLSREMPLERLVLRPENWFEENNISIRLSCEVQQLDLGKNELTLSDGSKLGYDKLLIATGSYPRLLPAQIGGDLPNVYALRSVAHADKLAPLLESREPLVIVGGGYIGLEVAAVSKQFGLEVTLVEMAERILQRVAAPETSNFFRDLHAKHGVQILEGVGLDRISQSPNEGLLVQLNNGETVEAGNVLCGIGVAPADELARASGLQTDNGIIVDEYCQASSPNVFAAGDCANFDFQGSRIRLESVPNAIHQAEVAAVNILGGKEKYVATPWFWSDQYDVKLQIAGLNSGYDKTVVRPGKREGAQSVWYYRDEQLIAVDAMNDAPAFMVARRIIESGKSVPSNDVADPDLNLKDFV